MKKFMVYLTLLLLGSICALGADSVGPVVVPAVSLIDSWSAWIQSHLVGSLASIGLVVEIAVRLVPSDKPRSVLLVASAVVHSVGKLLDSAALVLDGLLQNINKPK